MMKFKRIEAGYYEAFAGTTRWTIYRNALGWTVYKNGRCADEFGDTLKEAKAQVEEMAQNDTEENLTLGQKYIKESGRLEVSYDEATNDAIRELKNRGIHSYTEVYDHEEILDNPIYPMNADLYDEFSADGYFDEEVFILWLSGLIEDEDEAPE